MSREDVGQVDIHQVRDRGEQPVTSNPTFPAVDYRPTKNSTGDVNDSDVPNHGQNVNQDKT